ncbi:MAG: hypothetical protein ACTHME_01230, partial [Candidatus Nitrosocosmicus sp.]
MSSENQIRNKKCIDYFAISATAVTLDVPILEKETNSEKLNGWDSPGLSTNAVGVIFLSNLLRRVPFLS